MKEEGRRFFFSTQCVAINKFTSFYLYIIIIQNTHARRSVVDKTAIERYGEMARRV